MVAATCRGLITGLVLEPSGAQDVEPRPAYVQSGGGAGGVDRAAVEVSQDASDKLGRQAVDELLLCTPGSIGRDALLRQSPNMGAPPPNPRSLTL